MVYTINNLAFYSMTHYKAGKIGRKASVFNKWIMGYTIIIKYRANTRHRQVCKAVYGGHVGVFGV